MQPENIEDVYPLSPLQQGLLFHTLEAPASGVYVVQVTCSLRGDLDPAAFALAWRRTVERHAALRTAFAWEGLDEPVQVVCRQVDLPLLHEDWRGLAAGVQEARTEEYLHLDQRRGFSPCEAPLMRLALFRLAGDCHRLVWSHHHLLLDGWSLALVIREVFAHYEAQVRGQDLRLPRPRPYRDYIAWLRRQDAAAAESFWRRRLAGFPAPTPLSALAGCTRADTAPGAARLEHVEESAAETLRIWAKRERVTLNTLVQGAWSVLLSRYSGEEDIVFGVVSSGRPPGLAGVESMLGLFINTLPLRVSVARGAGIASWLRALQAEQAAILEVEHSALRQVQAWSDVPRGVPLFESLVDFVSYPPETALAAGDAPLDARDLRVNEKPSYPLALIASPGRELSLRLLYDPRRLDGAAVARLHEHLRRLLLGMAGDPAARLEDLPWLAPSERFQLLCEWNDTRRMVPEGTLPALFEARARTAPEAPAVLFGGEVWTYGELNRKANRLARHLRRLGVGPGSLVGVYLGRCAEMVSSLLAVLKAGGAYVPLDVTYPSARVSWILSSLGIRWLLTQSAVLDSRGGETLGGLQALDHCVCVGQGGDEDRLAGLPDGDLEPCGERGDLAYVIFTSGSTGTPKGVVIRHAPVLNLIAWANGAFGLSAADRGLFITSLCFDLSVYDIFGLLAAGGSIRIATDEEVRDPERLVSALLTEPITFWDSAPAALQQLVPFFPERAAASRLRLVFLSGDWIPVTLPDQVRQCFPAARVIALGGATEATVWSNSFTVEQVDPAWASIPYGRPIPNVRYHVLDAALEPCPIGAAGDLYISGECLTDGYAGEPALTAAKLLPDPHGGETGARLYRTGDRARFRADGNLEFLGRLDQQVKIRGFRIELGEIEAVLAEHPAVRETIVAAREDGPGGKRLVAYVVPAGGSAASAAPPPSITELRSHLAARLPEYMIPAAFVALAALPLTANGKVDRKVLPAPEGAIVSREGYTAPRTPVEERLAAIWAEVLRTEAPGVHDNFFHLGGDSILSIQIVSRARQQGLFLTSAQIFERQTIAEIAEIAGITEIAGLDALAAEEEPVAGPVPLTPAQRWFFDREPADPHHFNLSLLLAAREPLEPAHLAVAVAHLLRQHDALRLRFTREDGIWRQHADAAHTGANAAAAFSVIDLTGLADAHLEVAVTASVAALQAEGLDLARGPLLRAALLRRGGQRTDRLLLAVHHLAVDGVSWRILLEDLQTSYEQAAQGKEVRLPGKTAPFRLWAESLAGRAASPELEAELPFWLAAVTGAPRLPVDFAGGENTAGSAEAVTLGLTAEETRALLHDVPGVYRTRIDDVLLTSLSNAFAGWTGAPDLLVDVESHGREELPGLDLSRTVGWLTSIYPLRLPAIPAGGPGERLKAVKEALRAVPRLGIGFGLLRYGGDGGGTALREHAGAQVLFNYLGQLDQALPADSPLLPAPEPSGEDRSPRQERRHLLEISAAVAGGCLQVSWIYGTRLHQRSTIEALAASFLSSLRELLAHCNSPEAGGRTPSDFPLCALDQPAVDLLVGAGRDVEDIEDIYPLSPLQQGMLFHTLQSPASGVYWQQLCFRLCGELDAVALQRAWQWAVDRHSILRTSLSWEDLDEPLQRVHRQVELPFAYLDWNGLSATEREARLEDLLRRDREAGCDLRNAPLLRVHLVRTGDREHLLAWCHHHLLLDGWSLPPLYGEVFAAYEAFRAGREMRLERPRPFRDYIEWRQRQEPARAEAFWREYLRGFTAPTPLRGAAAALGARAGAPEHARTEISLGAGATEALQSLSRRHALTPNTLVQGAWALLLRRYSGESDVVFGSVSAGRPADLAGVESMLGAFLNTLPVRVRAGGEEELLGWLHRLQSDQLTLREHEHTPLQQIQEWSDIPRGLPLFESILIFESYPVGDLLRESSHSLEIHGARAEERTNYPVALVAVPGGELSLRIVYDRTAFDERSAARALGHLRALLAAMTAGAGSPLAALPLLSAAERHQLLAEWCDTSAPPPRDLCLHELFEERARRDPDAVAIEQGALRIGYGDLNRRADRLARRLRGLGVGPDHRVAILLERSPEMIVAILAVLKAGGAYLPIDPSSPGERLRLIARDAAVRVLLTSTALGDRIEAPDLTVLCLDGGREDTPLDPEPDLPAVSPDALAYVLYTSGSTGRPKGVMISHRGAVHYLSWAVEAYGAAGGQGVLLASPVTFDLTVTSLFAPLLAGNRIRLLAKNAGIEELGAALRAAEDLSFTKLTPSHLEALSQIIPPAEVAGRTRLLVVGGETLTAPAIELWLRHAPATRIVNEYGPTEAVVGCCVEAVPPPPHAAGLALPIGRPIPNVALYLLACDLQPVPLGVPGELAIGGPGLARGYLGLPALTAERFVPDAFGGRAGERLYCTGDLALHLDDGKLRFLGRIDHQLKIRGFRVEPGEIEAALLRHPQVREAVVVAREQEAGRARLVAYVVSPGGAPPGTQELRDWLLRALPDHMVPALFVPLEYLPLTANGKVDRRRLPDPGAGRPDLDSFVAPRTATEEEVARLCTGLLKIDRAGVHDDFFALGGDSLTAMRLTAKLRRSFDVEISLRSLYERPTVAGLAELIEHDQMARAGQAEAGELSRLLAEIEGMSDDEAHLLLSVEEGPRRGQGQ